jgi:hypothetical protein
LQWCVAQVVAGAAIVQHFGTVAFSGGAGLHRFGVGPADAPWTNVHNAFYTRASATAKLRGRETLTLWVNSAQGSAAARVVEIALSPSP